MNSCEWNSSRLLYNYLQWRRLGVDPVVGGIPLVIYDSRTLQQVLLCTPYFHPGKYFKWNSYLWGGEIHNQPVQRLFHEAGSIQQMLGFGTWDDQCKAWWGGCSLSLLLCGQLMVSLPTYTQWINGKFPQKWDDSRCFAWFCDQFDPRCSES